MLKLARLMSATTHPVCASLDTPLAAAGEERDKMIPYYFFFPSADKLRVKAGRTMVGCAVAEA